MPLLLRHSVYHTTPTSSRPSKSSEYATQRGEKPGHNRRKWKRGTGGHGGSSLNDSEIANWMYPIRRPATRPFPPVVPRAGPHRVGHAPARIIILRPRSKRQQGNDTQKKLQKSPHQYDASGLQSAQECLMNLYFIVR